MTTLQSSARIPLALFTIIITGCTTQSWYEGVKMGAENNCRKQPQSEVQGCLAVSVLALVRQFSSVTEAHL